MEQESEQIEQQGYDTSTTQMQGYEQTSQLLNTLVSYEVPEDIAEIIAVELSRDFVLANYKEEEAWEKKYDLKNILEFVTALFPPQHSLVQGQFRQELGYGDSRPALTRENMQRVRQSVSLAYARVTRSRGGWQQELLSQQTKEVRQIRPMEAPRRRGLFEKIFG